jgi:hypothetical protein
LRVSEPLKFVDIAVNRRYCVWHVMGNWPRNTVYKAERPLLVVKKRMSTAECLSPDANWPAVVLEDDSVISAVDIAAGTYQFREVEVAEGGEQITKPGLDDMSAEAWAIRVNAVVSYIIGAPGEKRAEYLTLLKAQGERLYADVRAELARMRDAAIAGRPNDYETLTFSPTTPIAAGVLEIRRNPNDLTDELWREYDFPGREKPYRIEAPRALYVMSGGTTHRVVDIHGVAHCVPAPGQAGCVLRWMPKDGSNRWRSERIEMTSFENGKG